MKYYLLLLGVSLVLVRCNNKADKNETTTDTTEIHKIKDSLVKSVDTALNNVQPSESETSIILANAKRIVQYIKDKNFQSLAGFVSPVSGLGFSSNSFIDSGDIRFSKEEVAGLWNNMKKYRFPDYGEGGKKTFREYYSADVYDKDFVKATEIELNKLKRGPNSDIFMLKDSYPNASFVDFHIPAPKDPDQELDWATLRLVFVKEGKEWWLVHIMHDNWTP